MKTELDKEKLSTYISITHTTIVICWVTLICYWVIKLLGGNWFEIAVHNENFIKFSEYVEKSWIEKLISFITIFITNYFLFASIDECFFYKGKSLLLIVFIIFSMWFVTNFIPQDFLNIPFWFGYVLMTIYAIIKKKGIKKLYGLFAVILTFLFSSLSILIRDISLSLIDNFLISNILAIDVYIMIALYYLYVNLIRLKKEND